MAGDNHRFDGFTEGEAGVAEGANRRFWLIGSAERLIE